MSRVERVSGIYPLADDDPRWRLAPLELLRAALRGGASVVQLRLKHTPDGEALELARRAAKLASQAGALLIVNDRYDLADLAGADGVHLGLDDLPPELVPASIRPRLLVGLSTHTLEQVKQSRDRPVDYIGFGPVFGTDSKRSEYEPRGVAQLREAVELAAHPVVAIGGICAENLSDVAGTGAAAAAVISALARSDDPETEARRLQELWR